MALISSGASTLLQPAISVTVDGQTYTFRDELGRPLWAGGNGKGRGGNP